MELLIDVDGDVIPGFAENDKIKELRMTEEIASLRSQ